MLEGPQLRILAKPSVKAFIGDWGQVGLAVCRQKQFADERSTKRAEASRNAFKISYVLASVAHVSILQRGGGSASSTMWLKPGKLTKQQPVHTPLDNARLPMATGETGLATRGEVLPRHWHSSPGNEAKG